MTDVDIRDIHTMEMYGGLLLQFFLIYQFFEDVYKSLIYPLPRPILRPYQTIVLQLFVKDPIISQS